MRSNNPGPRTELSAGPPQVADRSEAETAGERDAVADATLTAKPSTLRRLVREPLLHFLLIGLVLFLAYDRLHPGAENKSESNRIVLTPGDFEQLAVTWLAQGRPPPTPAQMQSLVELKVREEVLYREALALGLDKGDTIVKRRLAQKLEFLIEGGAIDSDPPADTLRAWFKNNAQRFLLPARVSFRHLYFSLDRRSENSREAAARALEQVAGKPGDWKDAEALGDPFMDRDYYGDRSADDLGKLFGLNFAQTLAGLKPGSWQGPVESGYGWHLVFVDTSVPARVPAFEEIEPDIKAEWIEDQRAEAKRTAYETMRARYQVVMPEKP
jgi:peptidyl-prolyl cis-trans isomerase C